MSDFFMTPQNYLYLFILYRKQHDRVWNPKTTGPKKGIEDINNAQVMCW